MSNDTFTLDVDQASEFKHAVKRNGGTNADIKELTSGNTLKEHLDVLRGTHEIKIKQFSVWKTVEIGWGPSKSLLTEMKQHPRIFGAGISIKELNSPHEYEKKEVDKLDIPSFSSHRNTPITLAKVAVADLAFDREPTSDELLERIRLFGATCHHETALYLRLQYEDQQSSPISSVVFSEPYFDFGEQTACFYALSAFTEEDQKDPTLFLAQFEADRKSLWDLDTEIIFVLEE